jgi:hypothetical protein
MGQTTFTGPVQSLNGFISGTATDPVVVDTAGNVSSAYATAENTTGDVRLQYQRLTVASTGSGETGRWLTRVTGVGAATGGTVNGGHISLSINSPGTVSGAGNALRVTLGGTSTNPGGTLAALQLDSDFALGGTWSNASYIRCTNSGTGTIDTFAVLPNAMIAAESAAAVSHVIPIKNASGTPYYIMVSNAA